MAGPMRPIVLLALIAALISTPVAAQWTDSALESSSTTGPNAQAAQRPLGPNAQAAKRSVGPNRAIAQSRRLPDGQRPYATCGDVRTARGAPVRRGEPGYDAHLDRDGDGLACETSVQPRR